MPVVEAAKEGGHREASSGLRLNLDRLTRLCRSSGCDDEIALRRICVTLYHLTDRSDCIDDGRAGRVGHETGKRLETAGAFGIV